MALDDPKEILAALQSAAASQVVQEVVEIILMTPESVFDALENCPVKHDPITEYSVVGSARIVRTAQCALIKLAKDVEARRQERDKS